MSSNANAIASTSQQQQQQSSTSTLSTSTNNPNSNNTPGTGTGTGTAGTGGGNTSLEDNIYLPLQLAGKILDDRLMRDERWIVVGDSLNGQASADYILPPNPAWAPFQKTRTVLLPDRLFEEHDLTQSRCSMGLLPEIDRAWVTVDHRLLLWDWSDGSSFSTFEELSDVIVGVALVKPRPGVFVDSISHILVLTTPSEVTLVGLGYASPSPGAKKEITFYLTGLTASTDGVSLTNIRGTKSGRIFLTSSPEPLVPGGIGGDGCLYEFVYQATEGWFAKRVTFTNLTSGSFGKSVVPSFLRGLSAIAMNEWIVQLEVDVERNLLYTLLRNGTIEMYQLLPDGTSPPQKVAKSGDILRAAMAMCPGSPMLTGRKVLMVSMEVISVYEAGANKVALVVVTSTGVRLYFTHQRRSYYMSSGQAAALELYHVRPPPTPTTNQPQPPPQQFYGQQQQQSQPQPPSSTSIAFNSVIQAKYSSGGLFLAANNLNSDLDVILLSAPDIATSARSIAESSSYNNNGVMSNNTNNGNMNNQIMNGQSNSTTKRFSEVAGTLEISGRTWDMVEITPKSLFTITSNGAALNELATQSSLPRREWVILTNMGANVIVRQRPVDTLLEVLEGAGMNGSGANGEVGVFFESYGRDQSCAMLLTIAAGNSRLSLGDITNNYSSATRHATSAVAEHAKALFFEGGGRPVSVDRGGYGTGQQATASDSKIIYSGRHEGLAFYFARLVRPIWKLRVTRSSPTAQDRNAQIANVSEAVLTSIQRDLLSLRSFVEHEHHLFTLLPDSRANQPNVAYQSEHSSIDALRLLLTQTVEAISFILLLIDYKISDIISACSSETQSTLLTLTYQDLLTNKKGKDVARALVSAVINQQIGRQLSVDAISDTLQQRCGSFCSADDVLMYKAIEAIRRARDTADNAERTESLRESLRLFIKAVKHLSYERLKEVCGEYNEMKYPLGVIDLALSCAQEWDVAEKAISYWLDGSPANDSRSAAFELRKKCNELVFESLELMDDLLNEASQPNRLISMDSYGRQSSISLQEADGLRTNAYNKALASKDEFFHSFLYDWYLSRGMTDQLLETRTPFLESYLSREPTTLEKADLLWQYYVRTSRYPQAASILSSLSETSLFPLALHKRVEYLSLAVGNSKSQFPSSHADTVEFLIMLEEKLEVALVQIEIYRAVEELGLDRSEREEWLERVEEKLFTISELYSNFAQPLQLLEIILLIVHVSDHRDPSLVDNTWDAILARADEAPEDQRLEIITSKIVELGKRFHSSEVAFPLGSLISKLEKYNFESSNKIHEARKGWVPNLFRSAGVSWDLIFVEFNRLFISQSPPWHTKSSINFLINDLVQLLEDWLVEITSSSSSSSPYGSSSGGNNFPATNVNNSIGKYLMSLSSSGTGGEKEKEVRARLGELQRVIRSRF